MQTNLTDDVLVKWKHKGEGSSLDSKKRSAKANGRIEYTLTEDYIEISLWWRITTTGKVYARQEEQNMCSHRELIGL